MELLSYIFVYSYKCGFVYLWIGICVDLHSCGVVYLWMCGVVELLSC